MILCSKNNQILSSTHFFHEKFFYRTIDHRTNMNFDLAEGDLGQHELFDKICAENINTLDDTDDQIFEERDHTFETVIEKPTERRSAVCSSDSDEDSPFATEDPNMDVDRECFCCIFFFNYVVWFLFKFFLKITQLYLTLF